VKFTPIAIGALVAAVAVGVRAQTPAPSFDVASVKKNTSGDSRWYGTPVGLLREGQISFVNTPLRDIVGRAYDVSMSLQRFLLVGGPESILTTRFDIRAKPAAPVSQAEALRMLRSLLAERFSLRIHSETRQVPVYALSVVRAGKVGPDIRRATGDCETFRKARAEGHQLEEPRDIYGDPACMQGYDFNSKQGVLKMRDAGRVAALVLKLQGFVDRPVVDSTGLDGNFDWVISFSMNNSPDAEGPSIFQAVQDGLGLKLESRTAPFEILVIDSVKMPTAD